jgi:hypothetical protein
MKKSVLLSAMLALPLAGLAVTAQAGNAVADVDLHLSTLGGGLAVAIPVSNSVAARAGFNTFNKSFSTTTTSANATINYNGNLKLSTYELLADWHPFAGIFHLTGGVMVNNNKLEATGTDPATGGTVNATVTFNKTVPYLGFGWSGNPKKTGFSFKSDIGVLFQGAPNASLTSNNATLNANLGADQAALNDKLKNFKYYPVVSIGIGYAF